MKKKMLFVLALVALVAGGAFAQRVGDTYTLDGQTYTVERVDGNRVTLVKELTIDGTWANSSGTMIFTISGNSAVWTQLSPRSGNWLDAVSKGMIKVGDQQLRNLRKTSDLRWSGQQLNVYSLNRTPDVAERTSWGNCTLTLSADGRTLQYDDATWTRR